MRLEDQLKEQILEQLNIDDISLEEFDDDMPLFGEGLGLDSLDAIELVVLMRKHYDLEVKDKTEAREIFTDVKSMADYIRSQKGE